MMNATMSKTAVARQLRQLDKESHKMPLADTILRSCKGDKGLVIDRVLQANAVIDALRAAGVTSFYAAEYAKIFTDPVRAMQVRLKLSADFETYRSLTPKQANKMADCIIFSASKKGEEKIDRVAALANEALGAGIAFTVVADVVYYNSPDVEPLLFAARCESTGIKQGKPVDIRPDKLVARLLSVVKDSAA